MGTIAAVCTTVGFIPQIIRGIKTRELRDVSPVMLTLLLVGCSLWMIYGVHLKDTIIILANGFTDSFVMAILVLRIIFKRNSAKK
jgi:MtN3 and saliva related transmembrane protein